MIKLSSLSEPEFIELKNSPNSINFQNSSSDNGALFYLIGCF